MSTTYQGRSFDWKPGWDDRNRDYLVRDLLTDAATSVTPYDRRQDQEITALQAGLRGALARITALEGKTPAPPAPTPVPPAPTPAPPPAPKVPTPTVLPNGDLLWTPGPILDQGDTGECVGYGSTDALAAMPWPLPGIHDPATPGNDNSTPGLIYQTAQRIEGDPPDDQSGTTVLAGMKACVSLGYTTAYHWALTVGDVLDAIDKVGPVVLGIPWTADMMNVDGLGFVRATGQEVGGHCILAPGRAADRSYVILQQSWGPGWGLKGLCYVSVHDLAWLLSQQGEAAVLRKIAA